jgi:limonene-1,2-epoxide hydrolase
MLALSSMKDPEAIVREFCAVWPERSIDKLLAYFTDDALYHNMPMAPVTGKDGIREILNMFIPADDVEAEILLLATRGNVVFTERIDRMTIGGKRVVLPCAGVFEIRDGKIAAWRDYFDLATWQRQTA